MQDEPTRRPTGRLTWRFAGLWLLLLALVLAATAIILAFVQAQYVSTQLVAAAEPRADRVATDARHRFDDVVSQQLNRLLRKIENSGRMPAFPPTSDWPAWLPDLLVWNGQTVTPIHLSQKRDASLADVIQSRLIAGAALGEEIPRSPEFRYLYETFNGEPLVCTYAEGRQSGARPSAVVACVDQHALREALLEPLVRSDEGLAIVSSEATADGWTRPLHGPFQPWSIRPSRAFLRDLRGQMLLHTAAYVALTLLSLGTVLLSMWLLMRIARRETALADLKAEFVARVSHELKTPLALIRMFGETLESGRIVDEEKRREYYAVIARESARLTHLIDNILNFSRIDAGKQQYDRQPADVGQIVRETYEAYRLQLEQKGFTHALQLNGELPSIAVDRDAIAQALVNLIGNAIKYSEEEKHVEIDVRPDTRRDRVGVVISVRDRGIGIEPEARKHLFEGYYRADDHRVRGRAGTGLGLAVVKHIVDAHDGTLDVESRLVKGTTFRIFLPGEAADRT